MNIMGKGARKRVGAKMPEKPEEVEVAEEVIENTDDGDISPEVDLSPMEGQNGNAESLEPGEKVNSAVEDSVEETGNAEETAANPETSTENAEDEVSSKEQVQGESEMEVDAPEVKVVQETTKMSVLTKEEEGKLYELVELIMEFGRRAEEVADDDEEEGAIVEDVVPFDRVPETENNSPILQLLNIPPEVNIDALVSKLDSVTEIVNHCYAVNATQIKIIFVKGSLAKEAKLLLDSKKLVNRIIQAVLCSREEEKPKKMLPPRREYSPPRFEEYSTVFPPLPLLPLPPKGRGARGMPPLPPGFPIPPFPPSIVPPLSPAKLPPRPLLPPMPIMPPQPFGEPRDGGSRPMAPPNPPPPSPPPTPPRSPPRSPPPSPPPPAHQPSEPEPQYKFPFGRNIAKREGRSLYDMLEATPQISNWEPSQSLEEQQRQYDEIYAGYGITNRYLLVGGVPDRAFTNINAAFAWLYESTKKKAEIEMCVMNRYAADYECENGNFLHLTFQRRADCVEVYNIFTTEFPELLCRYAAPRKPMDTLWMGNMSDFFTYCKDETDVKDMCSKLGEMRYFRYAEEKHCCFVGYATVEEAINARNRLLGCSFSSTKALALNVDFTADMLFRASKRPTMQLPDDRTRDKEDLSQKLGERLLSALQRRADGEEVIRNLLEGKEAEAVSLLARHNNHPGNQFAYDTQRGNDRGRPPRAYQPPYAKHPWNRTRKRQYSPAFPHEYNKHRKHGSGNADMGYDQPDNMKRIHEEEPPAPPSPPPAPLLNKKTDVHVPLPPKEAEQQKPKGVRVFKCELLKRGKPVCKVAAKCVRGDISHRIPQTLDVNQRANPERLANYLNKGPELSLWQVATQSTEDKVKYEGLCEYLISKKRVALVQEGPYEIYIVPPSDIYSMVPNLPDTEFMYAYVLPKGS